MTRYIHKTQVLGALVAHIQRHTWPYLYLAQLVDAFQESFISRLILLLVNLISVFNLPLEGLNSLILILLVLRDEILELSILILNDRHEVLLLVLDLLLLGLEKLSQH